MTEETRREDLRILPDELKVKILTSENVMLRRTVEELQAALKDSYESKT